MRKAKGNARSSGYKYADHGWYVEPEIAVDLLIEKELFVGPIWDPACGTGNIPKTLNRNGYNCIGTDLVDRGYGDGPSDFLMSNVTACNIVSNPPYHIAEAFVTHALSSARCKVAMLLRTGFLEGRGRYQRLYKDNPPQRIWQFSPRISMPPGGTNVPAKGGFVQYCWIIWDNEAPHNGVAFDWLVDKKDKKPKGFFI